MNLRDYERATIRAFVQKAADEGYLSGRVLDYGCGKQPYRDIVEAAGGEYVPYDREDFPANVSQENVGEYARPRTTYGWIDDPWAGFGARSYQAGEPWSILCTQVIQYVPDPKELVDEGFHTALYQGGTLVLTYPTNWPEVESEDLHRFTKAGMERLLTEVGFEIVLHEKRGAIWDGAFEVAPQKRIRATGEEFVLGYGCVARA